MTILELIKHYMPDGTDAFIELLDLDPVKSQPQLSWVTSPSWPPDLFAVIGAIIEQSGCYTQATPDYANLPAHAGYLTNVSLAASAWAGDLLARPAGVIALWETLINTHGDVSISDIAQRPDVVRCLLQLFAIADEVSAGIGWEVDLTNKEANPFAGLAFLHMQDESPLLRYFPYSFCSKIAPHRAVVLPKSITASVGCTIRSLSHNLALLPPKSELASSWLQGSDTQRNAEQRPDPTSPYDIRLLVVPYPFTVHARCFDLSHSRQKLADDNFVPAYFKLDQFWLDNGEERLTGQEMAENLFIPLINQAVYESGFMPDGIVLPECALTPQIAEQLVAALTGSGIEFLITGVLHQDPATGKTYNRASTFVLRPREVGAMSAHQDKHHRWRLDRGQTRRYALDFDDDPQNGKWWEDIEVGERKLPFFALRKDMSLATLICEDLARADPAMKAIRAVGPNLVVALLMDGPQLAQRWPGRYATVLADDPGSAVLSVTCAGMVDRSNWLESQPIRSIGLWRDADGATQEIGLPQGGLGVLLTMQSAKKRQHTLDNRSDGELSRQLTLRTIVPLFLADTPKWI